MMGRKHGWIATFLLLALIFGLAFALGMALMLGIVIPAYLWLLTDIWQWTPVNRWLRFVVLAAIGGVLMGALFTNYQWLVHTSSSLARKVVTTALVVVIYITLLVVLREWIGKILPVKLRCDAASLTTLKSF
ncbi:hypothetical protein [Variovorax paradoxus]|uniref:Uncharacterized protein n=1 Tax=Variovorax paradoxus TaxID=34073 RepID=A0A6I6HKY6_VARPD|nr:hypothetical protein [Variovorax paradoxus]QGW83549.1 hypothetical protein GOQ09_19025 [Variovorax paradoxus]